MTVAEIGIIVTALGLSYALGFSVGFVLRMFSDFLRNLTT